MSAYVDDEALRVARVLRRLAYKLPIARRAALAKVEAIDGWPERGEPLPRRGSFDPEKATPTEAAAFARLNHGNASAALDGRITEIANLAESVERDAERIAGRPIVVPHCAAGEGREGGEEWGDRSCDKLPEPGRSLCSMHRKREQLWHKRRRAT